MRIVFSGRSMGAWSLAAGLALAPAAAPAGIVVRAERTTYLASADGLAMVTVVIDGDDAAPGVQPVPGSLFSGGVRLRFTPGRLAIDDEGIGVVPPLDFGGFAPGAERSAGDGQAGFKGNIDLGRDPLAPYGGGTLAAFAFRLAAGGATVTVSPELPKDSANETIFVDGAGNPLDNLIRFEPFTIGVAPRLAIDLVPAGGGGGRSARLSFAPVAGFRHVVEACDRLRCAPGAWTPLPGAPHDSGVVLDPVTRPARFYRLVMVAE